MKLLFLTLILACGFFAPLVKAEEKKLDTLKLTLVVIRRHDISVATQVKIFKAANLRLKEVGFKVKINKVVMTEDVLSKNAPNDFVMRLYNWNAWARHQKIRGHVHFLLPQLTNGLQGGVAANLCTTVRNRNMQFSYSIQTPNRNVSSDISAHELLHVLGAAHILEEANLMQPHYEIGFPHPILPLTKLQVEWCKEGRTAAGSK